MAPSLQTLTPELNEKVCKELNEDPARREQDLAHIREWLKKQPHIKARTDDQWLITFLRGCKYSLERTKEKLDSYYTMRTLLPEFFSNRDPMLPEIQEVLKLGITLPLPLLDPEGRRVLAHRLGINDPSKVTITTIMKVDFMIVDILLQEDPDYLVTGGVDLMDMAHVTLGHAAQINPALAKKAVTCYQESYPVRQKGYHYINTPPMFENVFNFFKIVMREKQKRRIHMHGDDTDSLFQHLPQNMLPKDYGGESVAMKDLTEEWKKKIESYRDYFLEDEQNKTDEKKRPGKPKTQETQFGVDGSFRQLTVD